MQRNYIPVASAKQEFKKWTSILLSCRGLSQNVYCVKQTISSIRGNRSNILPLKYIHFSFQLVISLLYMYH